MLDHFLCYKAKRVKGAERFERRVVELSDQFQERRVELIKAEQFCNAVDKNGEGILDPSAHLTCYSVKAPRFEKRDLEVANQFGQFRLTVKKPNMLCVPSSKQVVGDN